MQPASSYPNKQTTDNLTIAAVPFLSDEQTKPIFPKANPNDHGVLPILIVMQNDSKEALDLKNVTFEYVGVDQRHIENTPAKDIPYLEGAKRPRYGPGIPSPIPLPKGNPNKSKLNMPEIEGQSFSARMLPAGDNAHGFLYFQARHWKGGRLYINGIRVAATGKQLFYFEIPLD